MYPSLRGAGSTRPAGLSEGATIHERKAHPAAAAAPAPAGKSASHSQHTHTHPLSPHVSVSSSSGRVLVRLVVSLVEESVASCSRSRYVFEQRPVLRVGTLAGDAAAGEREAHHHHESHEGRRGCEADRRHGRRRSSDWSRRSSGETRRARRDSGRALQWEGRVQRCLAGAGRATSGVRVDGRTGPPALLAARRSPASSPPVSRTIRPNSEIRLEDSRGREGRPWTSENHHTTKRTGDTRVCIGCRKDNGARWPLSASWLTT